MNKDASGVDEAARQLDRCWVDFIVQLRNGSGFDETAFKALCQSLDDCTRSWEKSAFVPKLAARVFIDLYPSIEVCAYMYEGDDADKIRNAAEVVTDLARRCAK